MAGPFPGSCGGDLRTWMYWSRGKANAGLRICENNLPDELYMKKSSVIRAGGRPEMSTEAAAYSAGFAKHGKQFMKTGGIILLHMFVRRVEMTESGNPIWFVMSNFIKID